MTDQTVILDTWSPLNHKSTMKGSQRVVPDSGMAPTWVPIAERRRLNAYITLVAYLKNVARSWILSSDRTNRREYGDPALIRDTIRGAVLGDGYRFLIDGAADEPPAKLDSTATEADKKHHGAALTEWQAVVRQQHWFERWGDVEHVGQKIINAENHAVGLGDGIYVFSWSNTKHRPRCRVYDPGFFFPVYDDSDDDFPTRVHLAWEFDELIGGTQTRFVRRITYEIIDDGQTRTYPYPGSADSLALEDPGDPHAAHNTRHPRVIDPQATSTSTKRCVMSDGVWKIADITSGITINDLSPSHAVWQINADGELLDQYDLGIDFIPVIHVPNTGDSDEHYGESSLLRVAQVFDDLQAADSDLASASALVGTPPIVVSGWEGQQQLSTYGPGTVFGVGEGDMKALDLSKSLDALIKHVDGLLNRLSINRQIPESVLGRVDINGQLAGVTLALSFGPFKQHIEELRLARAEKYTLFVKFVQRLGRVGGQLDGVYSGGIAFGSFLPSDVAAVVTMIKSLVQADKPVMSKATGLRLLQETGVEVEDIGLELERVAAEDFTGAQALADATAGETAALDYLGLPADVTAPPTIPDQSQPQPSGSTNNQP